jgi:hypothetical protein
MTRFFLALIATGIATLIGVLVIVAIRPHNPLLHRPPSLRAAPSRARTLMPSRSSGEPSISPAGHFWPDVDYPAISVNRGDGRRLLSFEPRSNSETGTLAASWSR